MQKIDIKQKIHNLNTGKLIYITSLLLYLAIFLLLLTNSLKFLSKEISRAFNINDELTANQIPTLNLHSYNLLAAKLNIPSQVASSTEETFEEPMTATTTDEELDEPTVATTTDEGLDEPTVATTTDEGLDEPVVATTTDEISPAIE